MSELGELLTTEQTSEQMNVPEATLRYWRHHGMGPRAFRLGARKVMYRKADVDNWLQAQYEQTGPAA